jgi:hypothetical protein
LNTKNKDQFPNLDAVVITLCVIFVVSVGIGLFFLIKWWWKRTR